MILRALVLMIAAGACASTDDLHAGPGVLITELSDRGVVAIDPARVPIAPACAIGAILRKSEDGWSCAELDPAALEARLRAIEARNAQLAELEERSRALESRLAEEEAKAEMIAALTFAARSRSEARRDRRAGEPLSIPAAACMPRDAELIDNQVFFDGRRYTTPPGSIAWARVHCPQLLLAPVPSWDGGQTRYRDPDGIARMSFVFDRLRFTPAPGDQILAGVDSNCVIETSTQSRAYAIDSTLFTMPQYYYHEVVLTSGGRAAPPSFWGALIEKRDLFAPPALQTIGGEVHVVAGWQWDFFDDSGRAWHADDNYLRPGHPPTRRRSQEGFTVDQSAIPGMNLPDLMLRTERTAAGELDYRLRVPAGDYQISIYFSENTEPGRRFDVRVEDQTMASFAPGGFRRAVALEFEVTVTDGVLEITIEDRPPDEASMRGFTVRRTR